jgi:tetratricopeptide (TPR) repeat protein
MIAQRAALARTCHRAAVIYDTHGREKEASYHFRAAVQLDPEDADARLHFAVFCEKKGKTDAAIQMYQEASRLRPQDFRPHLSLGLLHAGRGELRQAEDRLTKAIRFNPAFTRAYRELANLYMGPMKKLEEAEALARRAVHIDPGAANYDLLAWACYLNEKYDDAESASQTAVELEPDNPLFRSHYDTIRSRE